MFEADGDIIQQFLFTAELREIIRDKQTLLITFLEIIRSQLIMILLVHNHSHTISIVGQRTLVQAMLAQYISLEIALVSIIILLQAEIGITFGFISFGNVRYVLYAALAFLGHHHHAVSINEGAFIVNFSFLPKHIMKAIESEPVVNRRLFFFTESCFVFF